MRRKVKQFADGTVLIRCRPEDLAPPAPTPRKKAAGVKLRRAARPTPPSDLSRAIQRLAPEGYSAREIGIRLGIAGARVLRIAKRQGIPMEGAASGRRRVIAVVREADVPALDAIAERAAVDRAEIIRRLLAVALEDGGKPALRLLGKLAQPKRRRMKRAAREAAEAAARAAQEAESARRWANAPEPVRAAVAAGQPPLRAVRLHLGLRQRDIAERAGMGIYGETRVGELERSGRPLTPSMRGRLAAAMGVEAEWLFSESDARSRCRSSQASCTL